jgi:hypothetical protein
MTLPTSGLTFHGDASVNTDLWTTNTAGSFSGSVTDGNGVIYWDDVEHADVMAGRTIASPPVWRQSTPLMALPCLSFVGGLNLRLENDADTAHKVLSDVTSASAFTVVASIYVAGVTNNSANAYSNDPVIDSGSYFGLYLKNTGSDYRLQAFVWDGSAKVVEIVVSLATSYVVMFRLESGTLYASLDGGTESSVACGNISSLINQVFIGLSGAGSYNGRIGEVAIYNTALTGTNKTDALSYFTSKWLGGGGDTTAPTLTSAVGTQTGSSTATIGATTDEANGTMYGVVTVSGTAPSVAQIQAGQDNSGAAATYASSQSISSTGAKTFSATGLSASTAYYAHIQHKDAATNNSTVVTSAQFTTASGATALSKIIQQMGL